MNRMDEARAPPVCAQEALDLLNCVTQSPFDQEKCVQLLNSLRECVVNKVSRGLDLVYGGGSIGLMGLVSQAVHGAGGGVLGIIPRFLMSKEITGQTVGEVRPVADMHQRKAEMVRHSDCFIALPGGYGTLEELFEVITWAQLGIHEKPVGLLNVDGYYNSLVTFIDNAVDDGFIRPSERKIFVLASNAKELVEKLEEYVSVHGGGIGKKIKNGEARVEDT